MAKTPFSPTIGPTNRRLVLQLGILTLARLFINTSRRFPYTFATALSQGLGVSLPAITPLIAANQLTGLISPVFGPLGDRWGYRRLMLAALGMLAAGMLIGGFVPFYSVMILALFLAGLAKSVFDPALQAYVGEQVPYTRRGLAIGMVEFAWSGSALVGLPLVGLLIERLGWRSPFFLSGGVGLLSFGVLIVLISRVRNPISWSKRLVEFGETWQRLRHERAALGMLAFCFVISLANDALFVAYGPWLESAFAMSIVKIGIVTSVIGAAEFIAEGLSASLSDRLGLEQATLGGLMLSIPSYLLLPLVGHTLPLALAGLFVIFATFEFTIVTALSLSTEILPGGRATMMSAIVAAVSLGRAAGALIGQPVWLGGGMLATGTLSAALSGLALVCLAQGLRDWKH